jgi:hypothetical protein
MRMQQDTGERDARIERAIAELQDMIRERWPTSAFSVSPGDDPKGMYLDAVVDIDDTDEVMDVIVDRLLELQVEERLPVYVVLTRTLERIAGAMHLQPLQNQPASPSCTAPPAPRVSGTDAGRVTISQDFDTPLPELG